MSKTGFGMVDRIDIITISLHFNITSQSSISFTNKQGDSDVVLYANVTGLDNYFPTHSLRTTKTK